MRKHLLTAYDEAHNKLFIRYVCTLEEGLRETINNGLTSKVSWIKYRNHKYTMSEVYKLGDRRKKNEKTTNI